jgi:hypothetical protein
VLEGGIRGVQWRGDMMQSLQIRPALSSSQGAGEAAGALRSEWKGRVGQVLGLNPLPATRAAGKLLFSLFSQMQKYNGSIGWLIL